MSRLKHHETICYRFSKPPRPFIPAVHVVRPTAILIVIPDESFGPEQDGRSETFNAELF